MEKTIDIFYIIWYNKNVFFQKTKMQSYALTLKFEPIFFQKNLKITKELKLSNIYSKGGNMEKVLKNNKGVTLLGLMVTVFLFMFLAVLSSNTGIWQKAKNVVNSVNFARIEEEIELEIVGLEMDYFEDYGKNSITYGVPLEYAKNQLKKGITTATGATLLADETGNLTYIDKEGTHTYAHLDEVGNITFKEEAESNKAREELMMSLME